MNKIEDAVLKELNGFIVRIIKLYKPYSKLSDLEINTLVAEKLKYEIFGDQSKGPPVRIVLDKHPETFNMVDFDPCNRAQDAYQVIGALSGKLVITVLYGDVWYWDAFMQINGETNPFRAAMVIFLTMDEDKKDG